MTNGANKGEENNNSYAANMLLYYIMYSHNMGQLEFKHLLTSER